MLVRGAPNMRCRPQAVDAGRKLMEVKRRREKGHRITIITEEQFWRLARR